MLSRQDPGIAQHPTAEKHLATVTEDAKASASSAGLLRLLTQIGSPVALGTALMFYFGWIRTRSEAQAFGYDVSVTGMSVQDFVLKSIYVLYVPLLLPLILAIVLVWAHHRLIRAAENRARIRNTLMWLAGALIMSWSVWLALAAFLLIAVPSMRLYAIPVALTMALLCVLYGDELRRLLLPRDRLARSVRALVVVALIFAVFWDAERIAGAVGRAYAAQIGSNPSLLVAVTLFSPRNLDIAVPGVTDTRLTNRNSAYQYRYDGLRLLQLSGGNYYLISQHWDTAHRRVIVIPVSGNIRVEFSR